MQSINPACHGHVAVVNQTKNVIASLENAAFASSENLTCDGGHTHFNTESIRLFGLRYAAAYLKIMDKTQ